MFLECYGAPVYAGGGYRAVVVAVLAAAYELKIVIRRTEATGRACDQPAVLKSGCAYPGRVVGVGAKVAVGFILDFIAQVLFAPTAIPELEHVPRITWSRR